MLKDMEMILCEREPKALVGQTGYLPAPRFTPCCRYDQEIMRCFAINWIGMGRRPVQSSVFAEMPIRLHKHIALDYWLDRLRGFF